MKSESLASLVLDHVARIHSHKHAPCTRATKRLVISIRGSPSADGRLLVVVKTRRFDPKDDLIIVKARIYGPRGHRPLSLAFDTAASQTHIVPEIIDDLGYSPRQGTAITSVRSAIGKETGYLLQVTKFAALA